MPGHATQRRLSTLGMLAAAAVAVVGAALLSGTEACTLTTNDALPDAATEPDALRPRVSVCNACSVQQCTGQWAACLGNADCFAIYACAQTGKPQDCICNGQPKGQPGYRALAACAEVSACGACNAQCKDVAARSNCTSPGAPLSLAQCARDAGSDASSDAATTDGGADAELDGAVDAADDANDAGAGDAAVGLDAQADASDDAEAGPPALGDCTGCVNSRCADPKKACGIGSSCDVYVQCASACGDAACLERCGSIHASGKVALGEVAKCTIANCSTACGF